MELDANGKPPNCVLRFGAMTLEFGLEGQQKPLVVTNMFKYMGKSPQISVEHIDYDFDHSSSIHHPPQTSYFNDISIYNHLFPSSLIIFKEDPDPMVVLKRHLEYIFIDTFETSGIPHLNMKMVLIWNDETPKRYLDVLCDVLLNHFLLRSIIIVQDPLMVSISSGISMTPEGGCIVIDFGWRFTRLNVIYDNRVLEEYGMFSSLSCCKCHYDLKAKLNKPNLIFSDIEKLICGLRGFDIGDNENILEIKGYKFKEYDIVKSIIESLFPQGDLDKDEQTPNDLILNTIKRLPIDLRMILKKNIVITGGLSKIPTFSKYIRDRLIEKHESIACIKSIGGWQGGSLYSSKVLRHAQRHIKLPEVRRDR